MIYQPKMQDVLEHCILPFCDIVDLCILSRTCRVIHAATKVHPIYMKYAKRLRLDHEIYEVLGSSCRDGYLQTAIWAHSKIRKRRASKIKRIFIPVCCHNQLHIIRWMYSVADINVEKLQLAFHIASYHGYLETMILLHSFGNIKISPKDFERVGGHGNVEVAEWLCTILRTTRKEHEEALEYASREGHIQVAKWICNEFGIKTTRLSWLFPQACENGQLQFAKWIYSLKSTYIDVGDIHTFICACKRNHLEVAQWLYSFGRIRVTDDMFDSACISCGPEVAQWLYAVGIIYASRHAFETACVYGRLKTAQWLYDLGAAAGTDLTILSRNARVNCQIENAMWLDDIIQIAE